MPQYRVLEDSAKKLGVAVDTLREFTDYGWISIEERNGYSYLAASQEYKARFILDLQRRRKLGTEEITRVLLDQRPPYSMQDVDRILAKV